MKTAKPALSRRSFLLASGAAAAVSASTMTRRESGSAASAQNPPDPGQGYRVTEHVRHYYRTARI